jgi:hypothetical protein
MQAELKRCFARFLIYLGAETLRIEPQVAPEARLEWLDSAQSATR